MMNQLLLMLIAGLLISSPSICNLESEVVDLTLVGEVRFACSLPSIGIGIMDCLKNDLLINHITTDTTMELKGIDGSICKILRNENKKAGNVALLYDFLSYAGGTPADFVPEESLIKIAYSMIESSLIPSQWVEILNTTFDCVVVPDPWLVSVYENCGVSIPIFVLPHGIYLEEFLNVPLKKAPSKPFTFGLSAGWWERKNQALLIDAFSQEFGSDPNVRLKLHGRSGHLKNEIMTKVQQLNLKNIELLHGSLTQEQYLAFMRSLDCIVLLSKGEGFSIVPREALALGIPCIISDNSAHGTLCETPYFNVVSSKKKSKAFYKMHNAELGFDYDCSCEDVRKAMRDIYKNYSYYTRRIQAGRDWVEQYLWCNLRKKFLNLVKPRKVILGRSNSITNDFLETNSPILYQKYCSLTHGT